MAKYCAACQCLEPNHLNECPARVVDGKPPARRLREVLPCPACDAPARVVGFEFTQTRSLYVVSCPRCEGPVEVQNRFAALQEQNRLLLRALSRVRELAGDSVDDAAAWARFDERMAKKGGGS